MKNVLAIAAGASDGLGFGHNARAALITRGLAETGLAVSACSAARRETPMGLAGLGDLVLTCTGDLSRNRRVGLGARPWPAHSRKPWRNSVTSPKASPPHGRPMRLRSSTAIEMPIADAVYRVLYEDLSPRDAVLALLRREPRAEVG